MYTIWQPNKTDETERFENTYIGFHHRANTYKDELVVNGNDVYSVQWTDHWLNH